MATHDFDGRYPGLHLLYLTALLISCAGFTHGYDTLLSAAQPNRTDHLLTFEIVANSLVSAQQMFLGNEENIYILDKTENNVARINGHPAWASEFTLADNSQRVMNSVTNTFCAGGNVLGNGTWVVVGGNSPVTYRGQGVDLQSAQDLYGDPDKRKSVQLLDPCDHHDCDWIMSQFQIAQERWYPSVETLEDGTLIILGGSISGVYLNDANPTYEFFPPKGSPVLSPIIKRTLPLNLYPLMWLLPSARLLIQSGRETSLLDWKSHQEIPLDNMPDATRVYPTSAGTIMMPLTPSNNYTATVLFCGGNNIGMDRLQYNNKASSSCVNITPDVSGKYNEEDPLPEGRVMANLIFLPNGNILCLNGARKGTAGSSSVGQSYADEPILMPVIFNPNAPSGSRWSREGIRASIVPRMFHSSATLLPDGSVLVSGSNPNFDVNVGPDVKYPTEYRTERFYPDYYNQRRPQPKGIPNRLSYGGPWFDITLSKEDLFGNVKNVMNTTIALIRTGFSTHSMNMGQRYVELESAYTGFGNDTAILHVSQLPPNPAILAPGPALFFVVVNGIPSVGKQVMIGSSQLGAQAIEQNNELPPSRIDRSSISALGDINNSYLLESGGHSIGSKPNVLELICGMTLATVSILW